MAAVVNVQCILITVILLLPLLAQGSRPTRLMAAEMQQNVNVNKGKAQRMELLPSERKELQGRSMEYFQQQVRPGKVNARPLISGESARQVPTGPDPLHHNGSPIKPAFP